MHAWIFNPLHSPLTSSMDPTLEINVPKLPNICRMLEEHEYDPEEPVQERLEGGEAGEMGLVQKT